MAGNIVKWWKHKILGGYKQFSGNKKVTKSCRNTHDAPENRKSQVQECTTDSEELMYHQVRAPSSCSAPPDLLLVSDRENNIPLKSPVVNIITATTAAATSSSSQRQQQQHATKDLFSKNAQNTKISSNKNSSKFINMQATTTQQQQQNEANQQQQQHQQPTHQQSRHHGKEEPRIHLEEFTCDVSVEGGKSSQPLQFSFTFYDLDGHHGKITKDDIVGIVYTIYESIGKSVVVPHCGSKTINVRLTVSPEGKSKATANKLKKMQPSGMPLTENCKATATTTATSAVQAGHSRRQHRYRPRKLIKSDDEDDDSTSEKDLQLTAMAAAAASASANKSKSHASKYNNRMKLEQQQQQQQLTTASNNCCQSTENNRNNLENNMEMSASSCQHDNLYENMATNLKCCTTKDTKKCDSRAVTEECRGCVDNMAATTAATTAGVQQKTTDMYLKQASSRVKMLRKARKQKYQDHCLETRQRSLSVGSETCWKSRHTKNATHLMETFATRTQQPLHHHQLIQPGEDVIDGVQLRNPHRIARPNTLATTNRSSAECWKTALNRNDLISIIRESMEKNRLCFQLNGKPQASVSPIRQSQQRQRSNTVSKIPTLIANHNNFITNCNNSIHQPTNNNNNPINNEPNIHDSNTSCQPQQPPHQHQHPQHHPPHHSHHHPQPHIPIYHQQMAINPAVLAAQNGIVHSKMNLCGYDSFLHATICGGGTSHSPPPPPPATINTIAAHTQQPVATVQPIMNVINAAAAAAVPNSHQQQHSHYQVPSPRIYAHPITTTQQQIKTSKILRSGTFSQTHYHTATTKSTPVVQQSSPHYHGYHRLASTTASATKHNLAALNLQNPSMAKAQVEHLEKWLHEREQCPQKSKKDFKNYDNLLFAKLTEKLQDSTLNAESEKQRQEIGQRRKQRAHMKAQKRSGTADCADLYDSVVPSAKVQLQPQPQPEMIVSPVTSEQSNYAALIPINGDPIECENLLGNQTTDDETSAEVETPTTATQDNFNVTDASAVKEESTTGDLLDFNDDGVEAEADVLVVDATAGTGRNSSNSNSSGAAMVATGAVSATNNSSTASLIHRYVHEHIHHHYHHFEDKEEKIYE